jgi:hypothetical protein
MPARVGGRTFLRDTERLDRDLDWPARVLAAPKALQAEPGPVERETLTENER